MKQVVLLTTMWAFIWTSHSEGSVWHVELDGSGDFTVIQDAVDAAESGDTILLGPGRFIDTSDFPYYNGQIIQTCIALDKSLTFIGQGQGTTIIGPEPQTKTEYDTGGLACRSANIDLVLEDFSFSDCSGHSVLFDMASGGNLQMERVDIFNTYNGVSLKGTTNSFIRDCLFENIGFDGVRFLNGQGLEISNCRILEVGGRSFNCQFPSTGEVRISNCIFSGGVSNVALFDCFNISISDCLLSDAGHNGLYIEGTTNVQLNGVTVSGDVEVGIAIGGNEGLQVQNSIFEGDDAAVAVMTPSPLMKFHGNHILMRPGGYSVWTSHYYSGEIVYPDFRNNYWGTTDLEEISASILDGYDDPGRNMFILFDPIADGPVSTQQTTFGGLKSLYR